MCILPPHSWDYSEDVWICGIAEVIVRAAVIQLLQFLIVLLLCVHLYLNRVHFQKLCTLSLISSSIVMLTRFVELFESFANSTKVFQRKPKLAKFED